MTKPSTTDVQLKMASGHTAHAALATPQSGRAPGVVLIHEWWGLNEEMRATAVRLAEQGFLALAVDLYGGHVTDEVPRARDLMTSMDVAKTRETLVGWVGWLRQAEGCSGKVATLGFCMGGAWSLNASLATPVDATVIYYGGVQKSADDLGSLRGPVLGHFGRKDQSITPEMAEKFRQALTRAGKPHEIHLYEADHAFARLGGPNYNAAAADLAERRTLVFLRAQLR